MKDVSDGKLRQLLVASKRAYRLLSDVVANGASKHVQTTFLMLGDAIAEVERETDQPEFEE